LRLNPGFNAPVFSVLSNRDFRAIWYVGSLHEISRRMELLTLSLLILQLTGSLLQLSLILAINNVPRPLFSFYSGVIAERFNRRRILFVAQFINILVAAAILFLVVMGEIASWHIFVSVFLTGVTKSLEDPSRRTAIFDIVGEGRIVNALSLDTMSNTSGKIFGPFLGGFIVEHVNFLGPILGGLMVGGMVDHANFIEVFALVLALQLILLLLLLRVRIPRFARPSTIQPMWRSLSESIKFAWHSPILLGMLYITIIMNALAFPLQQFVPAIGQYHLGVGETLVGLLVAGEGLGQLIGAGTMALSRNIRLHGRVFVIGSIVVLLMAILFVWSPWYVLSFGLLVLGGAGQAGFGTMQSTITLLSAPPEMRGRMVGLMSVCIGLGTPLGAVEIGAMAAMFSTQWAISANALAGLILLAPAVLLTPLVWRPTVLGTPRAASDSGVSD
jgi:MFS family permease